MSAEVVLRDEERERRATRMAPARMRDRCGLLREAWYAAALSSQLGHKSALGCVILEMPIVLWRAAGGVAVAMEDRCAHRNAALSAGRVFDGRIGCAYHGWTYDALGRCVAVPSDGPGCFGLPCRIPSFPTRERDGLVWVWMGEGAPPKEPFSMPQCSAPGWGAYYMVTEFANGVTALAENFMDVPHTTFVHHGWFRKPARRCVRVVVERTPDSVLVTYDLPNDEIGFAARILNPARAPMEHTDRFYMPNTTRVDYRFGPERGFSITSTCTPRAPFETVVYTLISYRLGRLNPTARWWLPWYTRRVIRQDVEIMRNQGSNLQRFGEERFHSTGADLLHQHIEALREHAEGGGQGPPPEPRVDELAFWI